MISLSKFSAHAKNRILSFCLLSYKTWTCMCLLIKSPYLYFFPPKYYHKASIIFQVHFKKCINALWKCLHVNSYNLLSILNSFIRINSICEIVYLKGIFPLCLSLSLCISLSLSVSVSFSLSVYLCVCLPLSLSLSLSVCVCVYVYMEIKVWDQESSSIVLCFIFLRQAPSVSMELTNLARLADQRCLRIFILSSPYDNMHYGESHVHRHFIWVLVIKYGSSCLHFEHCLLSYLSSPTLC